MQRKIHSQMVPKRKQHILCVQDMSVFSFSGFLYLTYYREEKKREGERKKRCHKRNLTTFRCYSPRNALQPL